MSRPFPPILVRPISPKRSHFHPFHKLVLKERHSLPSRSLPPYSPCPWAGSQTTLPIQWKQCSDVAYHCSFVRLNSNAVYICFRCRKRILFLLPVVSGTERMNAYLDIKKRFAVVSQSVYSDQTFHKRYLKCAFSG